MKKKLLLLATVVLCLVCLLAVGVSAEENTPALDLTYANLSFNDSVYLKYAVSAKNITEDDVRLYVWTEPQSDYTDTSKATILSPLYLEEIEGEDYIIFNYTKLAAKQMTDVVYARAAVTVGETTHYSNVSKYSILRYAYTVQNDPDAEPTLLTMLTDMLDYGTSAQKHFDYKADRPANGDWYDIRVEGGTLADGFTYGLYMEGDQITLTADSAPAGKVLCWVNSAGVEQTLPITAPAQNETYTAVYKDEVTYSQGLEIEEDERAGAGYVVSIGNCTDTKIVIPPTTENGYPVTEIDRYAFQNDTTITSVSFPNTINTIGRYAFDGCTALTDVYYDGTEEEWAQNVDIESGNEAIENATKHFNAPPAESFIVTFVDYDGTVLKTESVESGKSATAPADPTREGFTFAGWDKAFDNVTADLTVTAQYTYHSTEPTVIVSSATASVGESVTVVVQILNNPGVAGAKFKLQYNDELTLTAAAAGKAFSDLDYTAPAALVNGCPFNWDSLDAESNVDGTFLTLTFTVGDGASVGDVLAVSASYVEGDVYNVELESVSLDIVNGSITVQ